MTFYLHRNESPADGLRRIATEQIGFVLRDFEDASLDNNARIHSLRARCKKMRALLRLPGPLMGDAFAREDARFRDAGRSLGDVRDDYVQRRTLRELLGEPDCEESAATDIDAPALADSVQRMREALAAVPDWPFEATSFYDIAPGYGRTYRKGRDAWLATRRDRSDEHFHKLRKWSKYLWYQTRILERMNRKSLHRQRVKLQILGELLGHAHDLFVLETGAHVEADAGTLALASRRKHRIYMRALRLCADTFAETPDEQVANLARWWQIWHQHDF